MLNHRLDRSSVNRSNSDYQEDLGLDFSSANESLANIGFELIIDTLDTLFLEQYERPLSVVEELLLKGVWQSKTYSEIARENNYSSDYFSNVAAPKLFRQLSQLVQNRINKRNCRSIITNYIRENISGYFSDGKVRVGQMNTSLNVLSINNYSLTPKDSLLNSYFLQDAISLAQAI